MRLEADRREVHWGYSDHARLWSTGHACHLTPRRLYLVRNFKSKWEQCESEAFFQTETRGRLTYLMPVLTTVLLERPELLLPVYNFISKLELGWRKRSSSAIL